MLEIAAGTGVVTRQLAILELAVRRGTARPVQWRQADAMDLPFADASFDVVLCQFGVMFFKAHIVSVVR